MSNPWSVLAVTIGLVSASAFFVAVEFALIAARRSRLEDAAPHSRAARAALPSASVLSVLLAGSQLGITVCTLALGAATKPAVHHWLSPAIAGWGAPAWLADVAGFVLALIIVAFLHLVVGEMATEVLGHRPPGEVSNDAGHPDARIPVVDPPPDRGTQPPSQLVPAQGRCRAGRPSHTGQDPEALRHLVEHSATVGTLDERYHGHLTSALELQALTIGDIASRDSRPASVPADADPTQIQAAARTSEHL